MPEQNLRTLALVAEIVSAVAVVISLIFVAYQVKDNTDAVRAATYDDILSDHIQWRMTLAENPHLTDLIVRSSTPVNELEESERLARTFVRQSAWQIYERAFFARKYETLGDSEWQRYERSICQGWQQADFEVELAPYLTEEFAEFARSCKSMINL